MMIKFKHLINKLVMKHKLLKMSSAKENMNNKNKKQSAFAFSFGKVLNFRNSLFMDINTLLCDYYWIARQSVVIVARAAESFIFSICCF